MRALPSLTTIGRSSNDRFAPVDDRGLFIQGRIIQSQRLVELLLGSHQLSHRGES